MMRELDAVPRGVAAPGEGRTFDRRPARSSPAAPRDPITARAPVRSRSGTTVTTTAITGPIYDGYWRGANFWWRDGAGHPFRRDKDRHFSHQAASGFQHIHGEPGGGDRGRRPG